MCIRWCRDFAAISFDVYFAEIPLYSGLLLPANVMGNSAFVTIIQRAIGFSLDADGSGRNRSIN